MTDENWFTIACYFDWCFVRFTLLLVYNFIVFSLEIVSFSFPTKSLKAYLIELKVI